MKATINGVVLEGDAMELAKIISVIPKATHGTIMKFECSESELSEFSRHFNPQVHLENSMKDDKPRWVEGIDFEYPEKIECIEEYNDYQYYRTPNNILIWKGTVGTKFRSNMSDVYLFETKYEQFVILADRIDWSKFKAIT